MKNVKIICLVFGVLVSFKSNGQITPAKSIENGKSIYSAFCMSCHMEDGNGEPFVYPSLAQAGNLGDKNRLVKIVLLGIRGPVVAKGEKINAEMPGVSLSDQEVADVINYIRNSWGNKAPVITVNDVVAAKKAEVKDYQPY